MVTFTELKLLKAPTGKTKDIFTNFAPSVTYLISQDQQILGDSYYEMD